MHERVVVVEDDPKQSELIRRYLDREGYDVSLACDGSAGLELARRLHPDLVILDGMLPGLDGLDVCQMLRREGDTPILMLTARSSEDDLLTGLGLGADDYMTKPYSPRELMARVRTLLRRTQPPQRQLITIAGLIIDMDARLVTVDGTSIDTTPAEFRLLHTLAAAPGQVFTRDSLLDHLDASDRASTLRTVDAHVKNLRKKIGTHQHAGYIQTVHGVGYRFNAALPTPIATDAP